MKRIAPRFAILAATALMMGLATGSAAAMPRWTPAPHRDFYSIDVLVDGRPVAEYTAGDLTYIEALKGREYSIRLANHTGRRVAVALSVDGLNTIDARTTTARDASKWILGPYQTITIDGWQTSSGTARRFFFSTERGSYGAWLGRTSNLGIISAAVFRERGEWPAPIWRHNAAPGDSRLRKDSSGPAPQSSQGGRGEEGGQDALKGQAAPEPQALDDLAATGIGEEVGHEVRRVPFDAEATPAAVLNLRYEFHDALVRLGVLVAPDPPCGDALERRERARGFVDMDFAPDPYRVAPQR